MRASEMKHNSPMIACLPHVAENSGFVSQNLKYRINPSGEKVDRPTPNIKSVRSAKSLSGSSFKPRKMPTPIVASGIINLKPEAISVHMSNLICSGYYCSSIPCLSKDFKITRILCHLDGASFK